MREELKIKENVQLVGLGGLKGSGKDTLGQHLVDSINEKGERFAIRIGLADNLKRYCVDEYGMDMDICHADNHTKNTTLSPVLWENMPTGIQHKYLNSRADDIKLTYREALQIIGTDLGRDEFGEDIWLERFTQAVNTITSDKPITVVITDVRFDNEAKFVMNNGGHVVRIMSDQKPNDHHVTEMGITHYNYEVEGKGRASLAHSKGDIETLYGYMELHERVRNFIEE
jgi:Ni2+-binding GTPase involved in maturation of urease and hydrogenase